MHTDITFFLKYFFAIINIDYKKYSTIRLADYSIEPFTETYKTIAHFKIKYCI